MWSISKTSQFNQIGKKGSGYMRSFYELFKGATKEDILKFYNSFGDTLKKPISKSEFKIKWIIFKSSK